MDGKEFLKKYFEVGENQSLVLEDTSDIELFVSSAINANVIYDNGITGVSIVALHQILINLNLTGTFVVGENKNIELEITAR